MAKTQKSTAKNNQLSFSLFLGAVTLIVLPSAMDPFLLPKSALLIAGGIWYFLGNLKKPKVTKNPLQIILLIFSSWLVILFVTSDYKWVSLFGVNGRAIGIIFYLALASITWHVSKFEIQLQRKVFKNFGIIGLLVLLYGLLQYLKLDLFDWNLVYKGIIGPFGNPNFMGAFSALVGICGISLLLNSKNNVRERIFGLLLISLSVLNIYASGARQGYVSLAIGCSPILVYLLFKKAKVLGLAGLGVTASGMVLFILGLFQSGPLAEIVYKQSVSYRGDFWRTAFNMIRENPLFGVGFERFGVNYRSYRDLPQVLRNGVDAYSDNAHNVYLQFAATGGVFLALIYLALNIYVGYCFAKKLKTAPENSYFYTSVFAIWLAIQAQSLISVDTPAIALWSWVFAGFICSQQLNQESKPKDLSPSKIIGAISVMAFSILSIFQLNAQTSMRTAFYLQIPKNDKQYAAAKAGILFNAEKHEPLNAEWPILSANSLFQDDAFNQTISAAKRAVTLDPKDYRGWYFLASAQEKLSQFNDAIKSRELARKIDPYNAENLLALGRDYKATNETKKARELIAEINSFAPNSAEYQLAVKELN